MLYQLSYAAYAPTGLEPVHSRLTIEVTLHYATEDSYCLSGEQAGTAQIQSHIEVTVPFTTQYNINPLTY